MSTKTNTKKNKPLNPKWELFCYLYARDSRCIGNATQAYIEAYELSKEQYESATRSGSRLLRSVEVRDRVRELLDESLEHKQVDRELLKVILQERDLNAKVSAIREYNRIFVRFVDVPPKTEITFRWEEPEPRPAKTK